MFEQTAQVAASATTTTTSTINHIQIAGPIVSYETWLAALASSACIGFTSLVPWLFNMTFFEQPPGAKQADTTQNDQDYRMKFLLSFAVGAILGDIFLHLIPESFQSHITELNDSPEAAHRKVGVSIIAGIFMFIIVEMLLEKWSHSMTATSVELQAELEDNREFSNTKASAIIISKPNEHKEQDLKRTIGALINYFEENDKLENNNNNLIKNLNFHLNNNNNNNNDQKGSILDRKGTIKSEFISDSLTTINKLTENSQQQLRCRDAQLQTIRHRENTPASPDEEDCCFAKSIEPMKVASKKGTDKSVEVAGYLSLIANGFDNFTHGLAIGASFLVGPKVGLLTTFVIFIHEIPHEICDYAILVNSGFSRWDAAKAQSSVSLFGILGTATALYVKSIETLTAKTCWILPFSAGSFLYIALVNLLPEILDHRTSFRNSTGQVACVILGIAFMALVGII